MSEPDLKSAIHTLMLKLERSGAHIYIPRADHDYAITVGLRMLTLRRVVMARDGLYAVARGQLDLLGYYANSIAHLVERADGAPERGAGARLRDATVKARISTRRSGALHPAAGSHPSAKADGACSALRGRAVTC
ncbi:MAG: hypothetical protein HYY77_21965 [Betaproteobacteria bacterium]|nr:hypothetical protein [Betaproteobacteria bacterium]